MFKEFKKFAMRGNVMDMAVGIIIGGAFGLIVASLVKDVLMPPIGIALGAADFKDLVIPLKDAVVDEAGKVTTEAVDMRIGLFINTIINFLIVAFSIFMVVKIMNKMQTKEEEGPPTTKDCPECCSTIAIKATRCPQCTSKLEAA